CTLKYACTKAYMIYLVQSIVAWGISYAGGYPIARKFLGESTMEEATNWLNRWGAMGIFLARMMPFAPSDPVSYIAGAGRMKFKTFIIPVIIGSLIATTLYTIMGYIVYRTGKDLSEGITSEMELADTILLAIFLGCLLLVAVVIVYQRRKLRELDRVAVPDDGFLTPEEIAAKSSPDPATSQEEIIERYEKAQKTGLEMDKALVTSFAIGFTIVLYIIVLAWLVINGIFLT
ncbi:MAG: TVP38/TMEM64 family protein, partial [Candidatus Hodarchaeota archaeon]